MKHKDLRSRIIEAVEKSKAGESVIMRKAYALSAYFLMKEITVDDQDVLAGRITGGEFADMVPCNLGDEIQHFHQDHECFSFLDQIQISQKTGLFCRNPGNHIVPGYDLLIQDGIQSRLERIMKFLADCEGNQKERDFYRAELLLLYAFQQSIRRYGNAALKLYEEGGCRNGFILRIAKACEKIACQPAGSFFEAVQLILFTHECVVSEAGSGSISFGRLDQYLYPYYRKDIETGKITPEEAQDIIIALWKKIAELEMSWQHVTLGGSNQKGEDECNELTLFCMEASRRIKADQPQVSLRIHGSMKDCYWDKAMELIKTGMGFPALYHDAVAVKAKMNMGISERDAWNYSVIGCVELTAGGKEYSHTEGARLNWTKILEFMLQGGVCSITGLKWKLAEVHDLDEFTDFSQFYGWYQKELIHATNIIAGFIDEACGLYPQYWPVPFASSLMQGCMEKGKDVTDCGTIYNNLCINCVGFASTVDSLEAIDELVFQKKLISLKEYALALKQDFAGYEWLQSKALKCNKYGNHCNSVDQKASELAELFVQTLQGIKLKYRDGGLQSGFYTSYFHNDFGKLTGASSDGRKAAMPLSSSLSAMSGMDRSSPTALINSANKINMDYFGNGMALDLKFTKEFLDKEEHLSALKILIEEYFEQGGMEIQFNVMSEETLLEAQRNPVLYGDLIVRVSGFSSYFRNLDKSLQDEIIRRTAYQGC